MVCNQGRWQENTHEVPERQEYEKQFGEKWEKSEHFFQQDCSKTRRKDFDFFPRKS